MENIELTREQLLKENEILKQKLAASESAEKKLIAAYENLSVSEQQLKTTNRNLKESEEKYKTLIEYSSDLIFLINNNGKVLSVNRVAAGTLGKTVEEIQGKNISDLFPKSVANNYERSIQMVFKSKRAETFESIMPATDRTIWINTSLNPVFDKNGDIVSVLGVSRDITKLKKSQRELQKSESKFKGILSSMSDLLFVFDTAGRFTSYHTHDPKYLYIKPEIFIGKKPCDILPSNVSELFNQAFAKNEIGELANIEYSLDLPIGHKWFSMNLSPIFIDKKFNGSVVVSREVTKQKQMESSLRESENRLRLAGKVAYDLIYEWNIRNDELKWYGDIDSMLGFEKGEISQTIKAWLKLIHPEDAIRMKDAVEDHRRLKDPIHYDYRIKTKDGLWRHWKDKALPVLDEDGLPAYWIGICTDQTEQKLSEETLRESEEKYRMIAENTSDTIAICTFDLKAKYLYASYSAKSMHGYEPEELMGKSFFDFIHPNDKVKLFPLLKKYLQMKINQILFRGETTVQESIEFRFRNKDGRWKNMQSMVNLAGNKLIAVSRDVTERIQAERDLKESRERLDLAIQGTNAGLWDWYVQTGKMVYNERWAQIFGYKLEELEPVSIKTWERLSHPNDQKKSKELLEKLFAKEIDFYECEVRMKHKNGAWIWVLDKGKVVEWDKRSNPIRMTGTLIDITRRKQAEDQLQETINELISSEQQLRASHQQLEASQKALQESEALYQLLSDATFEGIFISDKGLCIGQNKSAEKLFGYSMEEALNKPGTDWITPYDREKVKQNMLSGYEQAYYVTAVRKDGSTFPCEIQARMMHYNNKPIRLTALRDISQRKKAEQNLVESERRHRYAQQIAHVGNYEYDIKSGLVYWSDELLRIYGLDPNINGNSFTVDDSFKYVHPEDSEQLKTKIDEATESGNGISLEYRIIRPNDEIRYIFGVNEPTFDDEGQLVKIEGIAQDITYRKKTEKELKIALEKALESERLKSAFLANMSHEIRTPMNGIIGFIELLNQPSISASDKSEYSKIINKSSNRLLNTINDIIDISKLDAGQMKLVKTETSINLLMDELNQFFNPDAKSKGLSLFFALALSNNQATILTDNDKLHGILTNLIKNAIKYTDKGKITFGYTLKKNFIEFFVKDTGIGIPKNRQEAIFNRFEQADIEDWQVYEGSGLGLAISKAYVDMLGGKIWLESEEENKKIGKEGWSKFMFTIPYQKKTIEKIVERPKKKASELIDLKAESLKVLIAEDEEVSTLYLKTILRNICSDLHFVTSGREAIETCRSNSDFDIVLMDIRMPDIDGLKATQEIRKFNKEIIIIAQTAYCLTGDRENAIAAGCNDYVSKPINKELLLEMISKYILGK